MPPSAIADTTDGPAVAVVGAGIAGLAAAVELASGGLRVRVFDKGRRVGGRMSSRVSASSRFDHGAQYFTTKDPRFAARVDRWREAGAVGLWDARIASVERDAMGDYRRLADPGPKERLVGVPGMDAPCVALAAELRRVAGDSAIRTCVRVAPPLRTGSGWRLVGDDGEPLGRFDGLLVTAPAPQAAELLAEAPGLAGAAARVGTSACWAVMLQRVGIQSAAPRDVGFDAAFVNASALSWIARCDTKPGQTPVEPRSAGDIRQESWVLHGSPSWSDASLALTPEAAATELVDEWRRIVTPGGGTPTDRVVGVTAHRWRYALPTSPLAERFLADPRRGVWAAGDWCGGPRVEGAWLSGAAAAESILASLGR